MRLVFLRVCSLFLLLRGPGVRGFPHGSRHTIPSRSRTLVLVFLVFLFCLFLVLLFRHRRLVLL